MNTLIFRTAAPFLTALMLLFYVLQLLQIFGQPMAVLPLLMLSTGSISPVESISKGSTAMGWPKICSS